MVLSWSGGKDSALALDVLRAGATPVSGLLTTVTDGVERVSMHGVRRTLVHAQAAALGLPVHEVRLSQASSNAEYDRAMAGALARLRDEGVDRIAFGDLHLAEVRAYRESRLTGSGVTPLFPVWGEDTATFVGAFVEVGYRAVVVCVDGEQLDPAFCGRELDERFLADLPADVDPAGENGEYHTFVYDGPPFPAPIAWRPGEQVTRGGRFRYQDLLPA